MSALSESFLEFLTGAQRLGYSPGSVPARSSTEHPGFGVRRSVATLLALASLLTHAQARAEDRSVSVACPELDREDAAEVETRARAALLTSTLDARVAIDCDVGGVLVTAQSAKDSASVRVTPTNATFRDEVLAAVDTALERLRPQQTPQLPAPTADAAENAPKPPVTEPAVQATPEPASSQPPVAPAAKPPGLPSPSRPSPSQTELLGAAGFEAWSARLAGTARLGARYGGRRARVGVRGGVARLLRQDASFSATELSVAVEAEFEPGFARGIRLGLNVGPSLLVVAPAADVSALGDVTATTVVVGAELSRPLWFGHLAIVPALGIRWFGGQRGVTVDRNERFELDGFSPSVTLGLLYRLE